MSPVQAASSSSSDYEYKFTQILVSPKQQYGQHGPTKPISGVPVLTHDKKSIIVGSKYKIKFKDLIGIEQVHRESDSYANGGGGGARGFRGQQGSRAPSSSSSSSQPQHTSQVILVLDTKKVEYKCIANNINRGIAKDVHALEEFISGLKYAHEKYTKKQNKYDEYNENETNIRKTSSRRVSSSTTKGRFGGYNNNNHNSRGGMIRGRTTTSHANTNQVTPAYNPSGLHIKDHTKKRPTSGAFTSPAPKQRRGSSSSQKKARANRDGGTADDVGREGSRGERSSYAHYDPALHEEDDSDTEMMKEEEDDDDEEEGGVTTVVGNVVQEEVVSPSDAAKRLNFLPPKSPRNATPSKLRSNDDFNEDGVVEEERKKRLIKSKKMEEGSKRRRLKKGGLGKNDDDDDSDVEFDDEEEERDVAAKKKSSSKKKSRMSIEEEEDEDENEDKANEEENSPIKQDGEVETSPESKSPPSQKNTLANYFSGVPTKKKETKQQQHPPSTPPRKSSTFGAALSTPSRPTKDAPRLQLSTPPTRTEAIAVKPSTQKKKSSRYFGNMNITGVATKNKKKDGEGGQKLFPPYSYDPDEEEGDVLPGYGNDDGEYYDDENITEEQENEYDEDYSNKTAYAMKKRVGAYGRNARGYGRANMMKQARGRLGRARLGSSPRSNQFDHFKASSSSSSVKNPYMKSSQSKADRALSKRYNSPTPSRMSHMPDLFDKKNNTSSSSKVPNIPGLQNLGNTCYLSVSLQTLFSIPDFITDLYKTYTVQSSAGKKLPLTQALLEVATAIGVLNEAETKGSIDPEVARTRWLNKLAGNPVALKKQMDVLTDKFVGYEQRDAHEFLSDLVDYLHDELAAPLTPPAAEEEGENASTSPEEEGMGDEEEKEKEADEVKEKKMANDGDELPTDKFFHLTVRVCLECDSCGYSRSKDEMYRHLSVDVGEDSDLDKWSVERSLKQFFEPEQRELKCEKCESGKTATQTMNVISCPKALLLHFKRFIVSQEVKSSGGEDSGKENNKSDSQPRMEMVLRKNKVKIPLEESLSINPFVSKDEETPPGKYHLRGVVHHVGISAFSGHYTACDKRTLKEGEEDDDKTKSDDGNSPKDIGEEWVFFDDRAGTKKDLGWVTSNERNQRNCYMAVYEMK